MTLAAENMYDRRSRAPVLSVAVAVRDSANPLTESLAGEPLLAEYHAGDPKAAERLVAAYAPTVRAAVARYLALHGRSGSALADDLTHDVFLALCGDGGRKLRQFQGRNGCSFAGWLRVVAVRLTIDFLRRERRLLSLDDETPAMNEARRALRSDSPDPEEVLQGSEMLARLEDAMGRLGPKDRLLMEVHVLRGVPLQDVATLLGVSPNAAYVRKSRVLDRLRQALMESE